MAKFITNQNIQINLELAGLGDRILAFLFDLLIIGTYVIVIVILLDLLDINSDIVIGLFFMPLLFYFLLFEILANGQSPGKKVRDIRVVKLDGGAPGIGNYLLRWVLRPIDIWFYGAVAMISIIVTPNGQRLGDLAAGTTVIKLRSHVLLKDIKSVSIDNDRKVQFPQVRRLTDAQIDLIRRSLKMRKEGHSDMPTTKVASKIKEMLQIRTDMPDVQFLYTIIGDYQQLVEGK